MKKVLKTFPCTFVAIGAVAIIVFISGCSEVIKTNADKRPGSFNTASSLSIRNSPMSKPGGTMKDFLDARYDCLDHQDKFWTCMARYGWMPDRNGMKPPTESK